MKLYNYGFNFHEINMSVCLQNRKISENKTVATISRSAILVFCTWYLYSCIALTENR